MRLSYVSNRDCLARHTLKIVLDDTVPWVGLSCSGSWRSLGGGGGLVGVWILVGVWFWWVFGCLGLLGLFHTVTTTVSKMVGVPTTSSRLGLYNIILTKRDG